MIALENSQKYRNQRTNLPTLFVKNTKVQIVVRSLTHCDQSDGIVVRASASQSVDLGFIPLVDMPYQKALKLISTASLLGARHLSKVVENKPASSLVVSLDKALNGMPPPLCERKVAQTPRKWQLPSECRRPVQKTVTQFAFS